MEQQLFILAYVCKIYRYSLFDCLSVCLYCLYAPKPEELPGWFLCKHCGCHPESAKLEIRMHTGFFNV